MSREIKVQRCAIYTRKSSDTNLDLEFNSLDAQREAAEAYIKSQAHEGWRLIKTSYDDGGISGGTMERPALQRLLADIRAGLIDIIVVYKVDRLTRSLADFAKLVEAFEAHGVSFVSVTQQFNTTSSMGRLTLNVLLSFAQFEREVAGERIRDKIAASRRKGIWMGGSIPLGYDIHNKKLVPNADEAETVNLIFQRYLELGCVAALREDLKRRGIISKIRVAASSQRQVGGLPFNRGALYYLLRNRVYVGDVVHKGTTHPGEHEPIVERSLFDEVQARLTEHRSADYASRQESEALLAGLLYDDRGNRMSPGWSTRRGGRYRYYVSQAVLQGTKEKAGSRPRISATELETRVLAELQHLIEPSAATGTMSSLSSIPPQDIAALNAPETRRLFRALVTRCVVRRDTIEITLNRENLNTLETGMSLEMLQTQPTAASTQTPPGQIIAIPLPSQGRIALKLIRAGNDDSADVMCADRSLILAVARARLWARALTSGQYQTFAALAEATGFHELYIRRMIRLAWLSPPLVQAIAEGKQPQDLTLPKLLQPLPLEWQGQSQALSFPGSSRDL
jgi:site-specific DNA recombinase